MNIYEHLLLIPVHVNPGKDFISSAAVLKSRYPCHITKAPGTNHFVLHYCSGYLAGVITNVFVHALIPISSIYLPVQELKLRHLKIRSCSNAKLPYGLLYSVFISRTAHILYARRVLVVEIFKQIICETQ